MGHHRGREWCFALPHTKWVMVFHIVLRSVCVGGHAHARIRTHKTAFLNRFNGSCLPLKSKYPLPHSTMPRRYPRDAPEMFQRDLMKRHR